MTKLIYEEYFGGELKDTENPSSNRIINRWQYRLLRRLEQDPNFLPTPESLESRLFQNNYKPKVPEDDGTLNLNSQKPSQELISRFRQELLESGFLDETGRPRFDRVFKIRQPIFSPKLSGPRSAFLELINLCYLRCITCYNEDTRAESNIVMSPEKHIQILDELASFGADFVALTGGETTLSPDWHEIAKHAHSREMSIRFYTCGFFPNKRIRDDVVQRLSELKPKEIRITYSGMKETNDHVRVTPTGKGTFDRISETIRQLKKAGLRVKVNYTLAHENISEVRQFIDFVQTLGNGSKIPINLGPVRSYGAAADYRGFAFNPPIAEDFYRINLLVEKIRKEQGLDISINFDCLRSIDKDKLAKKLDKISQTPRAYLHEGCGLGRAGIGIAHDGTLNVCGIMGYNRDLVEHVIKIVEEDPNLYKPAGITPESLRQNRFTNINLDSMEDIWYNSPLLTFFQVFYKKEQCEPCDKYRVQCEGVCPGMCLRDSGDLRRGDQGCVKPMIQIQNGKK